MKNTNDKHAPIPMIGMNTAVFEMAGMRYLVVGMGPAEGMAIEPYPATPLMPAKADTDLASDRDKGTSEDKPKYVYGLKGIAELFGCSKSTAYSIKRSGKIDEAISQIGNTIVVDADKALALAKAAKTPSR